MAKVRRCDRCDKIYEHNPGVVLPDEPNKLFPPKYTHMQFVSEWNKDERCKEYVTIDLCEDCFKGLVNYVYNYEEKDEDTEVKEETIPVWSPGKTTMQPV